MNEQIKPMMEILNKSISNVIQLPARIVTNTVVVPFQPPAGSNSVQAQFNIALEDSIPKKIIMKNISVLDVTASLNNQISNPVYRIDIPNMCNFSIFINGNEAYFQGNSQQFEWSNYNNISNGQVCILSDGSNPTNAGNPNTVLMSPIFVFLTFQFFY